MSHVIRLKDEHGNWIPVPTIKGEPGRGIVSIIRTSGTGAPGTVDTYTITYTDDTTSTYQIRNGADGSGAGDMTKSVYDSNNNGVVDNAEKLGGELPEHYAEADHSHGPLTSDGKIGTTAGLPLFTSEGGVVGTKTAAEAISALGAAKSPAAQAVILSSEDWEVAGESYVQTVDAPGMRNNSNVIITAKEDEVDAYGEFGVRCVLQGFDALTFLAKTLPADDLTVNVLILG